MTTNQPAQPAQNGASTSGTDVVLPGPGPVARAQGRIKANRADALAELVKGEDAAPPEPKVDTAPVETPDPAPGDADDVDDADADEAPARVEDKPDAATSKRLAAVHAAEKRSREKLSAERAKFDAERAELAKERAEVETARKELAAYQKAKERAKVDPVAVLRELGVDDLEYAAKTAYAAAKGDPANREAAARLMREREAADKLADLQRRLDERDAADKERAEVEYVQREVASYVSGLTKAATAGEIDVDGVVTKAPLAKLAMAKNPAKTEARLRSIAKELLDETGDKPDHADVLARYEKTRRAELEELGVDPDSLLTATPKKPDQPADKKPSAKTLGNDLSTPRVPRPRSSERAHRAEVRAMVASGKLDS